MKNRLLDGVSLTTLVTLWIVTAAGRLDPTPPGPLALLVFLLPFLYAAFAGLLLIPALLKRGALTRWVLAATVLSVMVLWGWSWLPHRQPAGARTLTLLSWNVWRLGELASSQERTAMQEKSPECVARAVERERPDALALLEISRVRLEALQQRLDLTCRQTDYYGTGWKGAGGLAVCVRRDGPWTISQGRPLALPPQWHYVFTELQNDSTTYNFLAVHFRPYGIDVDDVRASIGELAHGRPGSLAGLVSRAGAVARTQGEQVEDLLRVINSFHDPTVVAGDFNSSRDSAMHRALRKNLRDSWEEGAWGFGATRFLEGWFPLRIDYIYATRAHFAVHGARVLPDDCSDHRAVLSVVGLEPAQ